MHVRTVRPWAIAASFALAAVLAFSAVLAAAPLAKTAFEQNYNPFGHPWETRRAPNPSIPVALTAACDRIGLKANEPNPVPEEIRFIATTSSPLVFDGCSFLVDAGDGIGNQRQKAYIAALKSVNPSIKYLALFEPSIAYLTHLSNPAWAQAGLAEIDANHEEWFAHAVGKSATRENRVRYAAGSINSILDIGNVGFRQKIIQEAVASMALHGIDGVVVEQCGDYPKFHHQDPSNWPTQEFLDRWTDGCVDFLRELKQAAPDKIVIFLGYSSHKAQVLGADDATSEAWSYDYFVRRAAAGVSDGMFWEDPLGAVKRSSANPLGFVEYMLARFRRAQDYAASQDAYLGVFINTNLQNQSSFASTTPEEQQQFARYYLAAYLTQFRGPKTPLIYYTPTSFSEQFGSTANFTDWNAIVGTPREPPALPVELARYKREFSLARVFFNGSDEPWTVNLADRSFMDANGKPVTSGVVEPRSGAVFRVIDPSVYCNPRPKVVVTLTRGSPGTLNVRISSGLGAIQSVQFGTARSAVVDIPNGPTGSSGGFTHMLSTLVTELTFAVRRNGPGGATVPLVVTDACGAWSTFVGGGPNAF